MLVAGDDDYSPSAFCDEYVEEVASAGFDVKIKKYYNIQHGWINEKDSTDCEDCMTFRDCGLMYIEDNGHESALDGRVTTLFGWREYLETVYRDCGTIGVIFRSDPEISNDTLETTVSFFRENLKCFTTEVGGIDYCLFDSTGNGNMSSNNHLIPPRSMPLAIILHPVGAIPLFQYSNTPIFYIPPFHN